MGNVGRTLFGGPSKQKEESGNLAYSDIRSAYGPAMGYTTQGGDMMASLLGLNGAEAQTSGLDNWAKAGGMDWMMEQGNRMINSNQAAKGLLNSGSTLKELTRYGQGLGSTYLNQYMGHLGDLSRIGLGAGGLVSDAGRYSKGKGEGEKRGLLGSLAAAYGASKGG